MWPFYLEEGVCLDEALHLDDSGACLLDVAGIHLERSRKWRGTSGTFQILKLRARPTIKTKSLKAGIRCNFFRGLPWTPT